MANNLFTTSEEMRKATLQKLMQQSAESVSGQGGLAQATAPLGALASTKLLEAVFGKRDMDPQPGDVDLSGYDLQTAGGNYQAAKAMREAGFHEQALTLEKMGMRWGQLEAAGAARDTAESLKEGRAVTEAQMEGIQFRLMNDPDYGETIVEILEDAKDNPAAYGGLKTAVRDIAQNSNEMRAQLLEDGIDIPTTEIERMMTEGLLKSEAVGEKGFLFWKSPAVDLNRSTKMIQGLRAGVLDQIKQDVKTGGEPIRPEPHQQMTQMQATQVPEVPRGPMDVQGSIAPEAKIKAEVLPEPVKLSRDDRGRVDAINSTIDKLVEQGQDHGGPAIQALIRTRDKIYDRY